MTLDDLLAQLTALDAVLSVKGERLLFDAPAGVLTADLRAEIAAHRAELVRRLSAGPPTSSTPTSTARVPAAADRFAPWVDRLGADGRLGWEPPDLPDDCRWWARRTFDDLLPWPLTWPPL